MRCAVLQINTNLLITERNIDIFTQETLYPSFISKKNWRSPSRTFFKHPLFTPFSLFLSESEICNISNKYWLPHESATKIFLRNCFSKHLTLLLHFNKTVVLSIAEGFRKIDFLPHFNVISERMRCAIFQINTDLVKVYEHINIFTQETLQPSFIWEILSKYISLFFPKAIGVLCHRGS